MLPCRFSPRCACLLDISPLWVMFYCLYLVTLGRWYSPGMILKDLMIVINEVQDLLDHITLFFGSPNISSVSERKTDNPWLRFMLVSDPFRFRQHCAHVSATTSPLTDCSSSFGSAVSFLSLVITPRTWIQAESGWSCCTRSAQVVLTWVWRNVISKHLVGKGILRHACELQIWAAKHCLVSYNWKDVETHNIRLPQRSNACDKFVADALVRNSKRNCSK